MISTRDLSELPDVPGLIRLNQSLATLDAILCPEWEFRYFSFNSHWEPGQQLGLMRNGEGDDWLILFSPAGAILKGFVHKSPMAAKAPWPGLFEGVPGAFETFLEEPAFSRDATTFCIWRLYEDTAWKLGNVELPEGRDPDGSAMLLSYLDGQPSSYKRWGDEYFGQPINAGAIERIYRHVPLNPSLVSALNPEINYRELCGEVEEIGYPIA
jgi:hypothetical protein